jgi:hypothetical protein
MAKMHASITADRVIEMVKADDNEGICTACGEDASGCEPDARKYECEVCGERKVYGAQELLFAFTL